MLLLQFIIPAVYAIHSFRRHQRLDDGHSTEAPSHLRSTNSAHDPLERHPTPHVFVAESSRDVNQDFITEVNKKIQDLQTQLPSEDSISSLKQRVDALEGSLVGGSGVDATVDPTQVADIKELAENNKIFANLLRTDLDETKQLLTDNDEKQTKALSSAQEQLSESIATKFSSLSMDLDSLKNQGSSEELGPQVHKIEADLAAVKSLTQSQQETLVALQSKMSSDAVEVEPKLWETLQGQVSIGACGLALIAIIVALARGGGSKPVEATPGKEEPAPTDDNTTTVPDAPAAQEPQQEEEEEEEEPI